MGKKLENALTFMSFVLLIVTLPVSIWFCFRVMREYERAVIFRLGRLQYPAKGPGLIFILPCTDSYTVIDLRVVTLRIPPQEVLTKDSVTVRVDACVYFKVEDPILCYLKIKDYASATHLLSATSLRDQLGTLELSQVLSDREAIAITLQIILDEATHPWGVKVQRVEIKDVSLPPSMQRVMAAEGEAIREAKAKVIAAQGELDAAMSLKEASDIIATNPAALQLRYLQTLNTIAVEQNDTIVFPLPIDILQMFIPQFLHCGYQIPPSSSKLSSESCTSCKTKQATSLPVRSHATPLGDSSPDSPLGISPRRALSEPEDLIVTKYVTLTETGTTAVPLETQETSSQTNETQLNEISVEDSAVKALAPQPLEATQNINPCAKACGPKCSKGCAALRTVPPKKLSPVVNKPVAESSKAGKPGSSNSPKQAWRT